MKVDFGRQIGDLFITGTGTDVGKTVATLCLGRLLQEQGVDVGVFKPVQCAGDDAARLKSGLAVADSLDEINPYFAPEPLSPHIAFKRQKRIIRPQTINAAFEKIRGRHEAVLIEGAGGLLVPLAKDYLMADLARELNARIVIVALPGLGTINHTLMTIQCAHQYGLEIAGVVFNQPCREQPTIAHETNPAAIGKFGDVPILGSIPYLASQDPGKMTAACREHLHLKKLCRPRRVSRTARLQRLDKAHIWHPFTQMRDWVADEPLVIDRADGNELIDTDGNRYLDGISSLWVTVHGHRQPVIDRALKEQIDRVAHSTLLGLTNAPAVQLARKLVEITPPGLDKVFYSDNGSTAVEVALKMAYQYWQNTGCPRKTDLVHLANSYHGDTLGSVSVGGIDLFHRVYRKLIFKTVRLDFPDCYRAPAGKEYPAYAFECVDRFEQHLKKFHDRTAALIVEPLVQGAAGMIVWPEGILRRFRELCDEYGVILITDEVATGFGRTGRMFACQHEGVVPDIMCLAKGITGGYLPLAATIVSQKIYDGFVADYRDQKTLFHGHTYTGNPLCCAAALANLEVFEKERVLQRLGAKIKHLSKGLRVFYNLRSVGDVRQKGFMVGIELVADRQTKKSIPWERQVGVRVCRAARRHGVILRPLGNVIALMPPLSVSRAEIDRLLTAAYQAIDEVTENEYGEY